MSGIDEQIKTIVPKCVKCGRNPVGYTLGYAKNPLVWLNVKEYDTINAYLDYTEYGISYEQLRHCNYIFCLSCNKFIFEKDYPEVVGKVKDIILNLFKTERV